MSCSEQNVVTRRQRGSHGEPDIPALYKPKYSLSVIPYSRIPNAARWLMKMHGCVSKPEDIVISSDDYTGYEEGKLK
eukprot:SAG31_NODE_25983_length_450_cov_1.452991_2_plen_76_part_01